MTAPEATYMSGHQPLPYGRFAAKAAESGGLAFAEGMEKKMDDAAFRKLAARLTDGEAGVSLMLTCAMAAHIVHVSLIELSQCGGLWICILGRGLQHSTGQCPVKSNVCGMHAIRCCTCRC